MRFRLILLLPALILFACRANTASTADVTISLSFAEESPAVGEETQLLITVNDAQGTAISDATVSVRGDMSHAGMSPVLGEATAATNGVYEIPFAFSMGGDWIITVDVTLADSSKATQSFNINGIGSDTNESESSSSMGVSAAYFTVSNNGTEDVRLLAVTAEGVGASSIHETIVENNIARMEEVEGGMLIPAGESVELAPSGHHVMLMNIANALVDGETLTLILTFDNGTVLAVDAPIAIIEPDEGASAEAESLSVSGAWLRPTTGGQ